MVLGTARAEPAHRKAATNTRAVKNAQHQRALREWAGPPGDPTVFMTEIWPRLRELEDIDLMNATGLSAYYCSQIRLGQKIPHPRHWDTLRARIGPIPRAPGISGRA
jgi:hypothetical protein